MRQFDDPVGCGPQAVASVKILISFRIRKLVRFVKWRCTSDFHRRVTAMRMISLSGIGRSVPAVQVGAFSYSVGCMSSEAICFARMATT